MTSRRQAGDARVSGPASASLRVERSGPGDVVARVTLARPEVHNAFDAALIGELRTAFATLARESPTELRAVVLAGDGPSFCAGADLDWMRAAMALDTEGNEQDAMAMADMFEAIDTCPVPVDRPRPRRGAGWRDGAVRGFRRRHRRVRDALRVHRDAAGDPAVGHQPVRRSPRSARATPGRSSRAAGGSTPRGRPGSGWSTRSSRARRRSTRAVDAAVADLLAAGPTAARAAKAIVREVRGLGHGSSKWHTARVIARQRTSEEAQEGFRAFTEKRRPAWAPDPDDA